MYATVCRRSGDQALARPSLVPKVGLNALNPINAHGGESHSLSTGLHANGGKRNRKNDDDEEEQINYVEKSNHLDDTTLNTKHKQHTPRETKGGHTSTRIYGRTREKEGIRKIISELGNQSELSSRNGMYGFFASEILKK